MPAIFDYVVNGKIQKSHVGNTARLLRVEKCRAQMINRGKLFIKFFVTERLVMENRVFTVNRFIGFYKLTLLHTNEKRRIDSIDFGCEKLL